MKDKKNGFALAAPDRPGRGWADERRQIEPAFHYARVLVRLEGLLSKKPNLSPLEIIGGIPEPRTAPFMPKAQNTPRIALW